MKILLKFFSLFLFIQSTASIENDVDHKHHYVPFSFSKKTQEIITSFTGPIVLLFPVKLNDSKLCDLARKKMKDFLQKHLGYE